MCSDNVRQASRKWISWDICQINSIIRNNSTKIYQELRTFFNRSKTLSEHPCTVNPTNQHDICVKQRIYLKLCGTSKKSSGQPKIECPVWNPVFLAGFHFWRPSWGSQAASAVRQILSATAGGSQRWQMPKKSLVSEARGPEVTLQGLWKGFTLW